MKTTNNQLIRLGALVALIGYIMSGPVAFLFVNLVKPQPQWVSPTVFVANYSTLQDIPFYFGFLLIGGMLMLATGHYLNYSGNDNKLKFHLRLSVAWTTVFCGLISFNYIAQTTFVHNLATHYRPEYDSALSAFSMSNPLSLCWAIEMWGYALLGIATWLMAGYYTQKNKLTRSLLVANGIVSVGSAIWTIVDINWVMTIPGLVGYFLWNALMILLMTLMYFGAKKEDVTAKN